MRDRIMGLIPPDKSWEEIDREAIALWKARRDSGKPSYSAERVRAMLRELERRCEEKGEADPAIASELLEKLRRGEPFDPA